MLAFHLSIYIIFFCSSSTDKVLGSICLLICLHVNFFLVTVERSKGRIDFSVVCLYLLYTLKTGIDSHSLYVVSTFYCLFLNYFSFKKLGVKAAKSRHFTQ